MPNLPNTQYALQLTGPSTLSLNTSKAVVQPGPYQILARIECVGLCFSDMKLLKQFDQHARKSDIKAGLSLDILKDIPSYVPGHKPTVPGHEVAARIIAVGDRVTRHTVGERVLVQTDYRTLTTNGSNAAFGYNFEGGLQEYVIMDERVVIAEDGERFLIPVPENHSASAIALIEPWACVEDSYVTIERQGLKHGGRLFIVADSGVSISGLSFIAAAKPTEILALFPDASQLKAVKDAGLNATTCADISAIPHESCDDIIYFGANKLMIEMLNDKIAAKGIVNIVLGGKRIGAPVSIGVGRVHYGLVRWIGTVGSDASLSYKTIPKTGELRTNDSMVIIGAGGPMGQMHVLRAISSGLTGISIAGADNHDSRVDSLRAKADAPAMAKHIPFTMVNAKKTPVHGCFSYHVLMAPVGSLVASAILNSTDGALINVFAGIPAPVKQELDLDTYIERKIFMFGTSGSTIEDMKMVLSKVVDHGFDTDVSVDAISGLGGAQDGITAVEKKTLAGKIMVYPWLKNVGLIPLDMLGSHYPSVATKLDGGKWCKAAEDELKIVGKYHNT